MPEPALVRVCVGTLPFFRGTFAVLAQADLQEHEQDSASEAQRHEHNRQQLTDQVRHHRSADCAGENECASRPERQDSSAETHTFLKVLRRSLMLGI